MQFQVFANKLFTTIGGGSSTGRFVKSLFLSLVNEDGQEIIEKEYKEASYKAFYNGNASISNISKKIYIYIEPSLFKKYINSHSNSVKTTLCADFDEVFPGATPRDIGDNLASLFQNIVFEAAKSNKSDSNNDMPTRTVSNDDLLDFRTSRIIREYMKREKDDKFREYLKKAKEHYSVKKTLLYAEAPRQFESIYVCNTIEKDDWIAAKNPDREPKRIDDATISSLTKQYKYAIIKGMGGIGKTMFLTHLLLEYKQDSSKKIPVLIFLKDFSDPELSIIQLAIRAIKTFDSSVDGDDVYKAAREGRLLFLLDGLDEIKTNIRNKFDVALDNFIKAYPNNVIIMSSRPTNSFVSYPRFALYNILPLTRKQAGELISKLEFWDTDSKDRFIVDLNEKLFESHYEFASNPLLLTIMLMTYSTYAEIPAKMHHFYAKAYLTMARLHDATKGCFVRSLNTGLSPEEYADIFAEFCARTYIAEVYEFDKEMFISYMKSVLAKADDSYKNTLPYDYLLDATDNLCLMYHEGEMYYFIHRSFQEYFAALFFSRYYDEKLSKVGYYFEQNMSRSNHEITFDMLCDMIPEKIERFVFYPALSKYFFNNTKSLVDEYWDLLEYVYTSLCFTQGDCTSIVISLPNSFIYKRIVNIKNILHYPELVGYVWDDTIFNLSETRCYVNAYKEFCSPEAYKKYASPQEIPEYMLQKTQRITLKELPEAYFRFFGVPPIIGKTVDVPIRTLRDRKTEFNKVIEQIESPDFPLMKEYLALKEYYTKLQAKIRRIESSNSVFDD